MKKRLFTRIRIVILCIVICFIAFNFNVWATSSSRYESYLAIGDSIAYGTALPNISTQSYAVKVRDRYNISSSKFSNLAVPGMTCEEFYPHIQTSSVTNAIKNAELISISIGSNELLRIPLEYLGTNNYYEILLKMTTLYDYLTSAETQKKITSAINTYESNWIASVNYIKRINPTADIIVTEFYNPYYGVVVGNYDFSSVVDASIKEMNKILWTQSNSQSKYKIAKVYSDFNTTSPLLTNVSLANANVDPHPNAQGHDKIYQRIVETLVKDISTVEISNIASQSYTGSSISPIISIKNNGKELMEGTDYTVIYTNNIEPGKATVMIKGIGEYKGSVTKNFNIIKNISNFNVDYAANIPYTGEEVLPNVVVKDGSKQLVKNTDYAIEYKDNINIGQAKITIKGTGYYTGTIERTFNITKKDISDLIFTSISDQEYTGLAIKPELNIINGNVTLIKGTDYSVTYSENINVGAGKIVVMGKGNYTGSVEKAFNIVRKNIENVSINGIKDYEYTGTAIKQSLVLQNGNIILKENTDYTLVYNNNMLIGTANVVITGIGNYTGSTTKTFKILKKNIVNLTYIYELEHTYNGLEVKPIVTVRDNNNELLINEDYTVIYKNNKNVGEASIEITGIGTYSGVVTKKFNILPKEITGENITITYDTEYTYNNIEIKPTVIIKDNDITLKLNEDYTLKYNKNRDVGKAEIVIQGKGNYTGSVTKTFDIKPKEIGSLIKVDELETEIHFTGMPIEFTIEVIDDKKILIKDKDYVFVYSNNVNVGKAVLKIEGKGNYTGTVEKLFDILPIDINELKCSEIDDEEYTGLEIEPIFTLKYDKLTATEAKDYTVEYINNVEIGEATVIITGVGNYIGSRKVTFEIVQRNIKHTNISNIPAQIYTGKEIKANVVIKNNNTTLVKGKDYEIVEYKNNVNIGKATIVIQGKGNYTGTTEKYFEISDKVVNISSGKITTIIIIIVVASVIIIISVVLLIKNNIKKKENN